MLVNVKVNGLLSDVGDTFGPVPQSPISECYVNIQVRI